MSHDKEAPRDRESIRPDAWQRAERHLRFLNVDVGDTLRLMEKNDWEVKVDGRVDRTGCYVILTDQNAIENYGTGSGKRILITSITEGRSRVASIMIDTVDGDGELVPDASQISISDIKSVTISEAGCVMYIGISNDEQVSIDANISIVH